MKFQNILASSDFLQNYLPVVVFFAVATVIAAIVLVLPILFSTSKPSEDKLKEYECGFDAFGTSRAKFDIKFYLVAILFIIFDLEVTFLVPWAISLSSIGALGFYSMIFFLFVLTIGFAYEWNKGVLDW